jgi:hypothetical protein
MADPAHLGKLLEGREAWNAWRLANPDLNHPDLSSVDFTADDYKARNVYSYYEEDDIWLLDLGLANLQGVDLSGVNLQGAFLQNADLAGANLEGANLQGANLRNAELQGANLKRANLQGARFREAKLQGANLQSANLSGATLLDTNLNDTDLRFANLEGAAVPGVKFSRDSRKRLYRGIRVSGCYGNQGFKTFAQDQDYIEELRVSGPIKFWIWYIFADCGRSFMRWAGWSLGIAAFFGVLYYCMGVGHIKPDCPLPFSLVTMIYYSVVTFTTLGFGDVKPQTEIAAIIVMLEVIIGYVMLGGLVSIFANKVARRS